MESDQSAAGVIIVSCQSRNQFLWFCEWKRLEPDVEAYAIMGPSTAEALRRSNIRCVEENFVVLPGGKDNQVMRKLVVYGS